jgi:hypothetical protein
MILPQGDRLKDVQVLALVFVNPLDLDVEHRGRVDVEAMRRASHWVRSRLFARFTAA